METGLRGVEGTASTFFIIHRICLTVSNFFIACWQYNIDLQDLKWENIRMENIVN